MAQGLMAGMHDLRTPFAEDLVTHSLSEQKTTAAFCT